MSSAASPNSTDSTVVGQSVESSSPKGLRTPPARPQLVGPPSRPKPPAPPPPPVPEPEPEPAAPPVIGPISAPSERMQYRAIGMLKGKYIASEEQFNRGDIAVADGTLVDAVLLGRVTSLIKKHIDLDTEHVWVVYPRTLYSEENVPALHVQIVGVWEPETLNDRNADSPDSTDESDGPRYLTTEEATEQCDHFSIRGEIAKYDEEKEEITINIVQKSKSETAKPKRPFKLLVNGTLTGRTVGYFWDLEVEREEGKLILQEARPIAVVPPKKKSKSVRKDGGRRRGPSKPRSGGAPAKPVPKPKVAGEKAADGAEAAATAQSSVPSDVAESSNSDVSASDVSAQSVEQSAVAEAPIAEAPIEETASSDQVAKASESAECISAESISAESVSVES